MSQDVEKILSTFDKLMEKVGIAGVTWDYEDDDNAIEADIDQSALAKNKPKNADELIRAFGKQLYATLKMNHPFIDPDKGKHYSIIKNKDGSYSIVIPLDTLKLKIRERQATKQAEKDLMTNDLSYEQIEKAILYLNGPNKMGHNIEGLHDDSHVLSIIPIKNDPDNCDVKIKSHFVRLGRSNNLEANVISTIVPTKRIKKFALEQIKIEDE